MVTDCPNRPYLNKLMWMQWEETLQAPQMPWGEKTLVCHPEWTLQGPWTKGKEFLLLLLLCFKSSYYEDLTQLGTVVHASDPHTLGAGADF